MYLIVQFTVFLDMLHFRILHKNYAVLNVPLTVYTTEKKKKIEYNFISLLFPGNSQKVIELILGVIYYAVVSMDAVLIFSE